MRDEELIAVRRARHEISAECGHDVHKVAAYCRAAGERLRKARGLNPKIADKPNNRLKPTSHE
jgi:hypothetical protein